MPYHLGKRSRRRLMPLHPDLRAVVERAIRLTEVDFTVVQGMRTEEEQEKLVRAGASKTMDSRHLTGHAVDLGAWIDGDVSWHWPLYYQIARAMQQAARELNVPLRWGGCWDKKMSEYGDPADAVADYTERRRKAGKRVFLDGPHFELPRSDYPA